MDQIAKRGIFELTDVATNWLVLLLESLNECFAYLSCKAFEKVSSLCKESSLFCRESKAPWFS